MLNDDILRKMQSVLLKVKHHSLDDQAKILQYYFLYLFKDRNKKEVLVLCSEILNTEVDLTFEVSSESADVSRKIKEVLIQCGEYIDKQSTDIENLDRIQNCATRLRKNMNVFIGGSNLTNGDNVTMTPLIDLLSSSQKKQFPKESLDETILEMFDQVIGALDPFTAKNYLDQSVERTGLAYKAALFDAMGEKHEQLKTYHETGLLLKDFSRLYLKKIRDEK